MHGVDKFQVAGVKPGNTAENYYYGRRKNADSKNGENI